MTDFSSPEPLDDEVLSAYLSGDLDEESAAALEGRLADDSGLARRLDATARVLAVLRAVDDVEPPAGAGERLRRRLAAEAEARESEPAADTQPTGAPVTTLSSRRRASWQAVAGIAAGLAAVALVGGGLLQGFTGGDETADMAADGTAADDSDMREFAAPQEETAGAPAPPDQVQAELEAEDSARATAAGPVVLDDEVALGGPDDVRARYQELAEADALLGEPLPAARQHAAAYRAAVAAASAFRTGARPGACLEDIGEAAPTIPVRVESAVLAGEPVIVYVLVGASPGATALDRVEARVIAPSGCERILTVDLS